MPINIRNYLHTVVAAYVAAKPKSSPVGRYLTSSLSRFVRTGLNALFYILARKHTRDMGAAEARWAGVFTHHLTSKYHFVGKKFKVVFETHQLLNLRHL